MLLLVLPGDLASILPDLAQSHLDVYNRDSEDLLTRRSLMTLQAGDIWVEIDAWECRFPTRVAATKLYVGLAAGDSFLVSRHDYGRAGIESFLCVLQGHCGSSGPNYRPWRYWTDEELEAAARGEPASYIDPTWVEPSRRVECRCVTVR
jgi:hypothetical protein